CRGRGRRGGDPPRQAGRAPGGRDPGAARRRRAGRGGRARDLAGARGGQPGGSAGRPGAVRTNRAGGPALVFTNQNVKVAHVPFYFYRLLSNTEAGALDGEGLVEFGSCGAPTKGERDIGCRSVSRSREPGHAAACRT